MSSSLVFNHKNMRKNMLKAGLAVFLAIAPAIAEARVGSGSSSGSRGSRTQAAPPATQTAPGVAQPMQRTTTPQTAPAAAARPQAPAPAQPGFFGGALGKGLLGGLIGAGLIGMFMGHGFGGGLGGMMSILGLLLQVALIGGLALLAWNFFARRRQPQAAMGAMGSERSSFGGAPPPPQGGGFGGLAGGAPVAAAAVQTTPLQLKETDFAAFEKLLAETQRAYSEESLTQLRKLATEEMVYYFQADIDENTRKGVTTRTSDVKLLQGDLSEAWREGPDDFATVAMRFSMVDVTLDRATSRVVEGDATKPVEATEVWTFLRPAGASPEAWQVSAIQQTA